MAQYKYNAIYFRQRDSAHTAYCIIAAPVGQILQWARVDRLEPNNKKGVQRKKNDSKTASIKRFFETDTANTIPTALTIALPVAVTNLTDVRVREAPIRPESMEITIDVEDDQDLPGLIIDGQHRIFGINSFDPMTPIAVVVMLGADDAEIAFQFLVINNKVSKVSPDHIKALRLAYMQDELDARLRKSARMRSTGDPTYLETIDSEPESPFKGRLKWPMNDETAGKKLIPPNAFEMSLLHVASQELTSGSDENTRNYDFVVDFFLAIWKEVQSSWAEAWNDPNSKLLSKLGVVCMSQYIVDAVIARIEALDDLDDVRDLEKLRAHARAIIEKQEYGFWTSAWNAASLDTSAGREIVIKDLRKIAINKRGGNSWQKGLKLIESLG